MDWDVEMDDAVDGFSAPVEHPGDDMPTDSLPTTLDSAYQVDAESSTLVPNKLHIRGLDTLNSADVKTFVQEHFGNVDRIEWIDDDSANLVFHSETSAQDALLALSAVEIADATQLPPLEFVPAKSMLSKPDLALQLRFAVVSDRKQAGAAARSRFYLLHPEYDPEERRRRDQANRSRYRDREGNDRGQRRNGRPRSRRDEEELNTFDVSLYDDDEATLADRAARARRRRRSPSGDSDSGELSGSYSHRNREKELFPSLQSGSARGAIRNRSASPMRDVDSDEGAGGEGRRTGTPSNRAKAQSIKNHLSLDNGSKELFPTKLSSAGRGQLDQIDVADETTRLMKQTMSISTATDDIRAEGANPAGHSSGEPFSIRGMAQQRGTDTGFAIKGAAGATVTELFPDRFGGNQGKELFAEKLEGRGRRRQRAEDLFS